MIFWWLLPWLCLVVGFAAGVWSVTYRRTREERGRRRRVAELMQAHRTRNTYSRDDDY